MSEASAYNSGDMSENMVWNDGSKAELRCRACGRSGTMRHVITTPQFLRDRGNVGFYRCENCESLNTDLTKFTDYDEDNAFAENAMWMCHYLHSGAGIDFMIRPLQRMGMEPGNSLIDVGCGVGFTVSFWNWAVGDGHGVEPSAYGRLGAEILDKSIVAEYLSNAPHLQDRHFDRVFSSEVIEHVDDPMAFVKELKAALAPGGAIVLTTPNGEFIEKGKPISVLLAALSPGLHRLLFSRAALESLLIDAGFSHVEVEVSRERLIAIASDAAFELVPDPKSELENYIRYLLDTAETRDNPDLKAGLQFRAFKELVNAGRLEEAVQTSRNLCENIHDQYGIDLLDPEACLTSVEGIRTFEDFGEKLPFFTPPFLFYASMASLNGAKLISDPKRGFEVSRLLGTLGHSIAPSLFQEAESLHWVARLHEGISAIKVGALDEARSALEAILVKHDGSDSEVPEDIKWRATRELGVATLQSGEPERALVLFRQVIEECPALRGDALNLYAEAVNQAQHWLKDHIQ